ncbi:phosphoribosyltransferase [Legionella fairfieldensis]|uniref:phosphoribosyltransferase n=1 Tax=Legionella fairfieldensis TaxID=45064 RepID=UPI00048B2D32|nr:phosphoribosyltransferase [Legionella fairfieldensis]
MKKFPDRRQAGKILAKQLIKYKGKQDVLVLALPRGGVPVAYEIARSLTVPLDVFIVRKLGVPKHEELAMGAIATGNIVVFNKEIVDSLNLSKETIEQVTQAEQKELNRRELLYRNNRPPLLLKDKTIILVDDGVATGATILVALKALRLQKPAAIIIAIPVAAYTTYQELTKQADEVICLLKPVDFYAVGLWYENFNQTTDEEVIELLSATNGRIY